jgi:hypothetical protein
MDNLKNNYKKTIDDNINEEFTQLHSKQQFSSQEQKEILNKLKEDSGKLFADLYQAEPQELYSLIDQMNETYAPAVPHNFFKNFVGLLKSVVGLREKKSTKQEIYEQFSSFQKEFDNYKLSMQETVSHLKNSSKQKAKLLGQYTSIIESTYKDISDLEIQKKSYEKNISFIEENYDSLLNQKDIDPEYTLELYQQQLFSVQEEIDFKTYDYEQKRQEKLYLSQEIAESNLQQKVFNQTKLSMDMITKKIELKLEDLLQEDSSVVFAKTQAINAHYVQTELQKRDLEEQLIEQHNEFVSSKPKLSDVYKNLYERRTKLRRKYR